MKLLFLGTGTSHGIPVIGCDCAVCNSTDPKDKRFRSSVYITTSENKHILIDIGPEFRMQCLANHIKDIDYVLLTHSHADHLHGIDDLRLFACNMSKKPESESALRLYNKPAIPIYSNEHTVKDVMHRFSYFFSPSKQGGGHAKVQMITAPSKFQLDGITVIPVPMYHGTLETTGWLLTENTPKGKKSIAYLTDCSAIPDSSIKLINENCGRLVHLVIDGLREKPHDTHFNFLQAMEASNKMKPEHVWFTHMTHYHSHTDTQKYIDQHISDFENLLKAQSVQPAYDQLEVQC